MKLNFFTNDIFMDRVYLTNTLGKYFTLLILAVAIWGVLLIFRQVILVKIKHITKKTETEWDDVLFSIFHDLSGLFYFLFSLYLAGYLVSLEGIIFKVLFWIFFVVAVIEFMRTAHKLIDFACGEFKGHLSKKGSKSDLSILSAFLKIVLWVVVILVILDNLGYEISTLVAGLGISGIAVALAVQSILKDIFSSLSIYFDRPFEVGDYVVLGEDSGNVKSVGIKTTRITTLEGDELVISNDTLTSSRIRNYGRMQKRRVPFTLGLEYDTKADLLAKVPKIVEEIIGKVDMTEFSRCHFKTFGDFSLVVEVVYYVKSGKYEVFMDIQQKINLEIKKAFEKEGIKMAFPTQTLHLQQNKD